MYYDARSDSTAGLGALEMTPSVALRALYEQLLTWHGSPKALHESLEAVFVGPLLAPHPQLRRPIGDPAHEAVAEYATFVIARAGQLTTQTAGDEGLRLSHFRQLSAHMTAVEHSLAIDLARIRPDLSLRSRQSHARATLALAAFWCDRRELIASIGPAANELLGKRPSDLTGSILWEHAVIALSKVDLTQGSDVDIDLTSDATVYSNSSVA